MFTCCTPSVWITARYGLLPGCAPNRPAMQQTVNVSVMRNKDRRDKNRSDFMMTSSPFELTRDGSKDKELIKVEISKERFYDVQQHF